MATRVGPAWTRRRGDGLFFTGMGLFVALIVFAGFAQTYYLSLWLTPSARAPEVTLLLQLHALVFTSWVGLIIAQPALVESGRLASHRQVGAAGAALAVLVWGFGNLAAIEAIRVGYRGLGDPYAFYSITFFSIQSYGIIVALAIAWRNRPDYHKRLILLSSAAILEAAVGRIPLRIIAEEAPFSFYAGSDLVIAAGVAWDLATRGRIHPVWLWGGGAVVACQLFRVAIMHTQPWLDFAHAVAAFYWPEAR